MKKLAAAIACALWILGCDQDTRGTDATIDMTTETDMDAAGDPAGDPASEPEPDGTVDAPDDAEDAFTARVQFDTSMGTFVVGLYGNAGPNTVDNFLAYVDDGFFDGLVFHRVIADFMIQGGGYDETLNRRAATYPPIELEIIPWLNHTPGVISMARTSDPHSATSQFFVCVATYPSLDGEYAAFGEVESGYDVVESISVVATHSTAGMDDVPVTNVVMNSVTRL